MSTSRFCLPLVISSPFPQSILELTSDRPLDAYNAYRSATGATLDNATGLLKITSAQFSALKPLNFVIGGTTYTLSANAQIWPRSLNTAIGGSSSSIYLVVNDVSSFATPLYHIRLISPNPSIARHSQR